jgi:hypothetical protein
MTRLLRTGLIGANSVSPNHDEETKWVLASYSVDEHRSTVTTVRRWLSEACAEIRRLRDENEQLRRRIAEAN